MIMNGNMTVVVKIAIPHVDTQRFALTSRNINAGHEAQSVSFEKSVSIVPVASGADGCEEGYQ